MVSAVIRIPCGEVAGVAPFVALVLWLLIAVYLFLALRYQFTPGWILLLGTGAITFSTCACG